MRGEQHGATVLLQMPVFAEQTCCDKVSRLAIKTAKEVIENDERAARIQRSGEALDQSVFKTERGLARTTLCFWPPLNTIPLFPTTVRSLSGIWEKSDSRSHIAMIFSYHGASNVFAPRIKSRILPLGSQGLWAQYAMNGVLTAMLPPEGLISPNMERSSVDFPQPTGPSTVVRVPLPISREMEGGAAPSEACEDLRTRFETDRAGL